MAEVVMATCSAPGCSEPGTNKCSSCKSTPYCGVACQTKDWPMHKEECQGHLRKMGIAHLEKTRGFHQERNLSQMVQYSNLALTKLMKLHPRTLEVIEFIDEAMLIKFNALNFMAQDKEALECAQERYSLWAAGNMRHYGMLNAALQLIEALLQNQDYEQSVLIASSAYEMITSRHDNIIPDGLQQQFLAEGSGYLAQATYQFARSGGIPPEETKKAGQEAIALARKALEIHTQMHGAESEQAAVDMNILADILEHNQSPPLVECKAVCLRMLL